VEKLSSGAKDTTSESDAYNKGAELAEKLNKMLK
jgi:hypothetical protein